MNPIPTFNWSVWIPLQGSQLKDKSPKSEGVYRIRDAKTEVVIYVGESKNLRGRFSNLQETFKAEIPFSDPHTAAPALWAYLQENATELEISFLEVPGDRPKRMSVESTYIAILRQQHGESPLANFGQMPHGWVKSSGNSKYLVDAGKRFKGFQDATAVRTASLPSILDLVRSPKDSGWCGLGWSTWETFPNGLPPKDFNGLYRITRPEIPSLSYIGQGKISDRLRAHGMKHTFAGHAQANDFAPGFQISWVRAEVSHPRQLLELEDDLIASHVISFGHCPSAQFIG